jgi:hypothetical protein
MFIIPFQNPPTRPEAAWIKGWGENIAAKKQL